MTTLLAKAGRSAWWLVLAAGIGAFWFGAQVVLLLFALASTAAVAGSLRLDGPASDARLSMQTLCAFLCVPLQYAFIARARLDLAIVVLPLIVTIVMPLLTVLERRSTPLLPALAGQHLAVLLWVYCLSHAPALLLLDIAGFAAPRTPLIAFLVVLSFTSHALWRLPAPRQASAPRSIIAGLRWPALSIAKLALIGTIGALLSWMSPFSPVVAMAMALLIAAFSWLGCFAMAVLNGAPARSSQPRAVEMVDGVPYPYALAFAAPVFIHAVRAWRQW
jgi:phosphatidate cytidylyltransferase